MWVILRLLTALVVGLVKFFWRSSGGGERKHSGKVSWRLDQKTKKGRVVSTAFGLEFEHPVFFRLTEEGSLDRFFKGVGFSREIQSGDPNFDQKIYVSCDHPALAPVLQAHDPAREEILALFEAGVEEIFADGRMLWARCKGDFTPREIDLGALVTIRHALNSVPAEHLQMLRDPFFWKALLVESIAWSILVYGLPAWLQIAGRDPGPYFSWTPVIKAGLLLAVGLFAFLFALTWLILRGSSRAHRVLTESAFFLLIGVPFSSIHMVSDANIVFDRSPPTIVSQRVDDKYTRITRHKSSTRTYYHLRISGATPAGLSIPSDIEVESAVYAQASKGSRLEIVMRSGAAGMPWVETVRAVR
jgi:hypothetical protein